MDNILFKSSDGMVEICEMPEDKMAGRVKIKMSSNKVVGYQSLETANSNGICWLEEYVEKNKDTIIGAPYVVDWLYTKEEGIPSGHGTQSYTEDGNVVFTGETVGTIMEAYVTDIDIDGVSKKVLMTEGYLFTQRNQPLIDFLKSQKEEGNTIFGSVEINGKNGGKTIKYLDGNKNSDGTLKMDRVPVEFSFSGLAILYIATPSDNSSQIFELNTLKEDVEYKELEKDLDLNISEKEDNDLAKSKTKQAQTIELNELSHDDIAMLITKAFNRAKSDYEGCYEYYIHRFYPASGRVIMREWSCCDLAEYHMTTYTLENNILTLGEIVKVEEEWVAIEGETEVEINAELIKEYIVNSADNTNDTNKEVKKKMEEKILELNQKIEENSNTITDLGKQLVELQTKLNDSNEAVVNANKALEESTAKVEVLEVESNELKTLKAGIETEKEASELEAKTVEINAYFENDIKTNGFADEEVETLKEYVEKCDFEGLRNAEAELCVKKIKEMKKTVKEEEEELEVETNSLITNFISIKEKEVKEIKDGKLPTFFNN